MNIQQFYIPDWLGLCYPLDDGIKSGKTAFSYVLTLLDSSATAPKITEKNKPDHLVSKDNSGVLITLTTTNYKDHA